VSKESLLKSRTLKLISIGEGSSNNYAYLVVDDKSKDAVIVDPANPPEYIVTPLRISEKMLMYSAGLRLS
jgi:glyoxylase-like metal-dependent hydrolase (beta-lactamase superfamily II)